MLSYDHLFNVLCAVAFKDKDKDLFIGPHEFVVGYSKAPEQPQSSARPIYMSFSHYVEDGARTSHHTHCCIGARRATHCATGDYNSRHGPSFKASIATIYIQLMNRTFFRGKIYPYHPFPQKFLLTTKYKQTFCGDFFVQMSDHSLYYKNATCLYSQKMSHCIPNATSYVSTSISTINDTLALMRRLCKRHMLCKNIQIRMLH